MALEAFFTSHSVAQLLAGTADTAGHPRLLGALRRVRANAPVALRLAEWLIDEGMKRPLAEGMQLELDRLRELFATRDAFEGLSALGKRLPMFQGC